MRRWSTHTESVVGVKEAFRLCNQCVVVKHYRPPRQVDKKQRKFYVIDQSPHFIIPGNDATTKMHAIAERVMCVKGENGYRACPKPWDKDVIGLPR